jgi:hypothetical protein
LSTHEGQTIRTQVQQPIVTRQQYNPRPYVHAVRENQPQLFTWYPRTQVGQAEPTPVPQPPRVSEVPVEEIESDDDQTQLDPTTLMIDLLKTIADNTSELVSLVNRYSVSEVSTNPSSDETTSQASTSGADKSKRTSTPKEKLKKIQTPTKTD